MVVAMMVGMIAAGAIFGTALAATGSSIEEIRLGQPELFLLVMAAAMGVPMIAWMRHRGHGWSRSAEMAGAMFVPPLALMACYRLGGLSNEPRCPLACAAMIPTMVLVMLFRLDEYTRGTRTRRPSRRARGAPVRPAPRRAPRALVGR